MLSSNRKITDIVKFIAALLVVHGHTFMFYSGMPEASRWLNLGEQCVSLFLFFSAYGLMCAYEKKGVTYLQGFIPRRIGRILIPLLTAYVISLPIYAVYRGSIDWTNVIGTLYWGGPYLRYSWYVTEIAVLYLLYYGCAKCSKNASQLASMLTISVALLMCAWFIAHQSVWYINGLPCFILGIWYQRYEKQILSIISNRTPLLLCGTFLCFMLFFQWRFVKEAIPAFSAYRYEYAATYLSNIFFVIMAVVFIGPINPKQSTLNLRLGGVIHSFYEIYLVQNAVMIVVTSFPMSFYCTWLLIMGGSVTIGYIMNCLNKKISSLLYYSF